MDAMRSLLSSEGTGESSGAVAVCRVPINICLTPCSQVFLTFAGLSIGIALRNLLKKFKIALPYTVCLLILGIAIGGINEGLEGKDGKLFGDVIHSIVYAIRNLSFDI